ncbi:MAG: COX15/CtaA family protein [Planctomycetales bacterium]|nr:COX15/CtaA family protein [Planctomycetales bacterium]
MSQQKTPSWLPYGLSLALLYVTFPLIWMGGLVTTYDAGMAVPDWPSTYGYNLFLYPWSSWIGGPWDLFVEHGHRLLASLAGLIAIALVVVTQRYEPRAWVRRFAVGALALVILQGVLGGARVLLDQRTVAMVHACVGPLFFMYAGAMACFTEPAWRQVEQRLPTSAGSKATRLAWITLGLAFVQLVLGANLRHIRVDASAATFRAFALFHIGMAFVVLGHAVALAIRGRHPDVPKLVRGGCTRVAVLVTLQVALGVATWTMKYGWPIWLPTPAFAHGLVVLNEGLIQSMTVTAHMAIGSMILIHTLVAAVRGSRMMSDVPVLAAGEAEQSSVVSRFASEGSQLQECVA